MGARVSPKSQVVCKKDGSTNTVEHNARYTFQRDNDACQACSYFDPCRQVGGMQDTEAKLKKDMQDLDSLPPIEM